MASLKNILDTAKKACESLEDRIVGYPNMYRIMSRAAGIAEEERSHEKINYTMHQMVAMPSERVFVTMILQADDVFDSIPPEKFPDALTQYLDAIKDPGTDLPVNEMFDQNPHLCQSGIDPADLGTLHSFLVRRMNATRPAGRTEIDYDKLKLGFERYFTIPSPNLARLTDAASAVGSVLYKGLDFARDTLRAGIFMAGLAGLAFTGFALYSYSTGNYNRDAAMHVFEPPKHSTDYNSILRKGHGVIQTADQDFMIHYLFPGMTLSDIKEAYPNQGLEFSDFHMFRDGNLVKIPVDRKIYETLKPQYIAFPIKNEVPFQTGYAPGQAPSTQN